MKYKGSKKIGIILIVLGIIMSVFGGTLAYLRWETSESQKTAVTVTIEDFCQFDIDGGITIDSSNYNLIPTGCMDPDYAIQRELTLIQTSFSTYDKILFDMWIDVNKLDSGLANSENFKYALTTSATSCTENVISSGDFTELITNQGALPRTNNIFSKVQSSTTTEKYYLYIWLDSAETSSSTMNQTFKLSLNGSCTNDQEQVNEAIQHTQ